MNLQLLLRLNLASFSCGQPFLVPRTSIVCYVAVTSLPGEPILLAGLCSIPGGGLVDDDIG